MSNNRILTFSDLSRIEDPLVDVCQPSWIRHLTQLSAAHWPIVTNGKASVKVFRPFRAHQPSPTAVRLGICNAIGVSVHMTQLRRPADGAQRLLDLVPTVPAMIWGHDEMRVGEMWNSNSVIPACSLGAECTLSQSARRPEVGTGIGGRDVRGQVATWT